MNAFKKLGLACVCVVLVSCGRTGPDTEKQNGASSIPSGSNTSGNSQNSSVATSAAYSAVLEDVEITEGSLVIADDNTVVEEGNDATAPLKFTLNKPLAEDAQVTAVYDIERSNCTRQRVFLKNESITVTKEISSLTFTAMVYRNNNPEDDCDTAFNLSVNYGNRIDVIKANGYVRLKDDDALHDSTDSQTYQQGDFYMGSLNGDRRYDGTTYTVTQLSGPKAEFKVFKDKLHMIMPEFSASQLTPVVVKVAPSNIKHNTATYTLNIMHSSFSPASFSNVTQGDGDDDQSNVDFLTGIKDIGFVRDNIAPEDLLKLSWVLKTKSTQNTVEYIGTGLSIYKRNPLDVAQLDSPVMNDLLQLDADNRTLRFKPEAIPTLKKYLNDTGTFFLHVSLNIYSSGSKYKGPSENNRDENGAFIYENVDLNLPLRIAPRKLTVHLNDISADQLSQRDLRLVVRARDDNTMSNVRVVPVTSLDTTFSNLYEGVHEVKLIDFEMGEIDSGIKTIEPKDLSATYNLNASKAISVIKGENNLKKSNSTKDLQGKIINAKIQKPALSDCETLGGSYLVRASTQDEEISCEHTFTAQELKGDTPKKSRQLVIDVVSLEYPSFIDEKTTYKDSWSWSLTTSIAALDSMAKSQSGTVILSNKDRRTFKTVSPCFTLDAKATDTLSFTAKVTNIGDNNNATIVSSKIEDCAELYKIDSPKLTNREAGGVFLFANKYSKINNGEAYISLPYGLTENDKAYKSTNNAFGFTLNIFPLKNDEDVAKEISVDSLVMGLHLGATHGQDEENLVLGTINKGDVAPKINVSNILAVVAGKSIVAGKKVIVTNYRLPIGVQGHTIPYPATNRTVSLTVSANLNVNTKNSYETGDSALRVIDNADENIVNLDTPNLRPLLRIEALKALIPRDSTRFDWITNNQRFGQGVDDNPIGGDTWLSPSVWKNVFTLPHATLMSGCPADVINLPAFVDLSPLTACMPGIKENATNSEYPDYLDNLSLNDASAVHVRCLVEGAKCKSILKHSGHQLGTSLDLGYLDADGNIGVKFPSYYYNLWAAAEKTPKDQVAINKLKKWVNVNRAYIQSIIKDQRGSSFDFSMPTSTKVKIIYLGKGDSDTPKPEDTPTIFSILTKGILPAIASDTSLGTWNPYPWIKYDGKFIVQEMTPHDNHFHVEFEPSKQGDF